MKLKFLPFTARPQCRCVKHLVNHSTIIHGIVEHGSVEQILNFCSEDKLPSNSYTLLKKNNLKLARTLKYSRKLFEAILLRMCVKRLSGNAQIDFH